jgi:hypothetical protein
MTITAQKVIVGERMFIESSAILTINGQNMSTPSVTIEGDALPEGAAV